MWLEKTIGFQKTIEHQRTWMVIDKKFYNDNNALRSLYDWKNLQLSLPRVESGSENRIFSRIPALLIITLVGKSILRAFFAKRAQIRFTGWWND